MFINPQIAIDNNWIEGPYKVAQNAFDFTLDRLFTIDGKKTFYISERQKQMRGGVEVYPKHNSQHKENYWRLDSHTSYDGMSDVFVKVPKNVAALLIVRSSFNRNGIFITSGLYDAKFEGNIGMVLHNQSGIAFIAPGTRIGQLIFVESESVSKYNGQYNTGRGQHWSETQT